MEKCIIKSAEKMVLCMYISVNWITIVNFKSILIKTAGKVPVARILEVMFVNQRLEGYLKKYTLGGKFGETKLLRI